MPKLYSSLNWSRANCPTLQQHRAKIRLTTLYKIIHNLIEIPFEQYLLQIIWSIPSFPEQYLNGILSLWVLSLFQTWSVLKFLSWNLHSRPDQILKVSTILFLVCTCTFLVSLVVLRFVVLQNFICSLSCTPEYNRHVWRHSIQEKEVRTMTENSLICLWNSYHFSSSFSSCHFGHLFSCKIKKKDILLLFKCSFWGKLYEAQKVFSDSNSLPEGAK